ncbi:caspase family protein [Flammeovirgaceae bacterium SG7u.111]|nr:caspase family protein [Flammeovirgaceae bacterium SG7u.132]WPO37742.1 caspase family protein [Flammeovirgaceae bacterium SG7u.111]
MKNLIALLFLLLLSSSLSAQYVNLKVLLKKESDKRFVKWAEKGEFESSEQYKARMAGQKEYYNTIFQQVSLEYEQKYLGKIDFENYVLGKYDADNEVFPIKFEMLDTIYLKVPRDYAPEFKSRKDFRVENVDLVMEDNSWSLSEITIRDRFYDQVYQNSGNPKYKMYQYEPPVVPTVSISSFSSNTADVDIDENIPETDVKREDALAVVLGVEYYQHNDIPNVQYAVNDALAIKKYLIKTMGFKEEQIIFKANPTMTDMNYLFGGESSPEGKLYNTVNPQKTDVFVYFSGHGIPNTEDGKAFFALSDANPYYVKSTCYPLELFYRNLSQVPCNNLTIVLDACFSGGSHSGLIIPKASPVFIMNEARLRAAENVQIMTSSSGTQISSWYPEKNHSMFTYFFLKGIMSDANSNDDDLLTFGELAGYVNEQVTRMARKEYGRIQQPSIDGEMEKVFVRY